MEHLFDEISWEVIAFATFCFSALVIFLFLKRKENKRAEEEKKKAEEEKKRIENERIEEERRIENLKNESVQALYSREMSDGIGAYVLKRSDNTFAIVSSNELNINSLSKFRILREKADNYSWVNKRRVKGILNSYNNISNDRMIVEVDYFSKLFEEMYAESDDAYEEINIENELFLKGDYNEEDISNAFEAAIESEVNVKFKYERISDGTTSMRTIKPSYVSVGKYSSINVEGFCYLRNKNRTFKLSGMSEIVINPSVIECSVL